MIQLTNITKSFEQKGIKHDIYRKFSLRIQKNSKIALFGVNGIGKTTLFNIISGLDKEFNGKVSFDKKIRIAYMPQNPETTLLPWYTCLKNIMLIREYHGLDKEKGLQLLNELISELDIDFSLKKYPFMLSGGQKQIISLLRSLLAEPDVILLDEPFSALDIEKRKKVTAVLKRYCKDKILLIISHRGEEVAELIDEAIMLSSSPIKIDFCISSKDYATREEFEQEIIKIKFNGQ